MKKTSTLRRTVSDTPTPVNFAWRWRRGPASNSLSKCQFAGRFWRLPLAVHSTVSYQYILIQNSNSGKNQWFMIILEHIQAIYEKKNIQKKVFSIEKKNFLPPWFPVYLVNFSKMTCYGVKFRHGAMGCSVICSPYIVLQPQVNNFFLTTCACLRQTFLFLFLNHIKYNCQIYMEI